MKKFKYRLEALLKLKDHIEKERQKRLADSMTKVQRQVTQLEEIDTNREQTVKSQKDKALQRFSVAEMLVVSRYLLKLRKDTRVGQELLRVLRKDEDAKRQELFEATVERKKYEKLKEVQKDKHYREMETVLTKEADENAVNFFRQKQNASETSHREKNSAAGK